MHSFLTCNVIFSIIFSTVLGDIDECNFTLFLVAMTMGKGHKFNRQYNPLGSFSRTVLKCG